MSDIKVRAWGRHAQALINPLFLCNDRQSVHAGVQRFREQPSQKGFAAGQSIGAQTDAQDGPRCRRVVMWRKTLRGEGAEFCASRSIEAVSAAAAVSNRCLRWPPPAAENSAGGSQRTVTVPC